MFRGIQRLVENASTAPIHECVPNIRETLAVFRHVEEHVAAERHTSHNFHYMITLLALIAGSATSPVIIPNI